MNRRLLFLCGMIAPWWFVFMTILGGAIRPGYSHIADTISELFSPGSPNKLFLDILHTTFAVLLILFGIGLLQFFRDLQQEKLIAQVGASSFLVMGCVSVTTATIFPQDPWGTAVTIPGEMHKILSGAVGFLSILSMLLIGIWFQQSGTSPRFGIYSYITIGLVIISASIFSVNVGSSIMGLAERIAALIGFQWTFSLAYWMFSSQRFTRRNTFKN